MCILLDSHLKLYNGWEMSVKKKFFMIVYLILSGYWDRAVWIYEYRSIVNDNKERRITYCQYYFNFNVMVKWQICYTEVTNLLQFTINVWKTHCQPRYTLHIMCRDCMLFVWVDIHVSLCRQQHP